MPVRQAQHGIEGLIDATSSGRPPKLSPAHQVEIKALVEKGPNLEIAGGVHRQRIDLARVVKERFG